MSGDTEQDKITQKYNMYLNLIKDSYKRMSTNEDVLYRIEQKKKVDDWLNKMTSLVNEYPEILLEQEVKV